MMRHWLLTFPALALASQLAVAHPSGPPASARLDRLTADLGLDANQKLEVERIFTEQRARHEQARQDLETQLATVLTPEQLDKLRTKMAGKRGPHGVRRTKPADAAEASDAPQG
jgi:hypothetical protein